MPVIINDEMAETADLTNEELGALVRLKWAMWKSGGYLADDSRQLARIARAGSRWGKIAPAVLALFTVAGGKVSSSRLLSTLLITRERRAKNAKAVTARWAKPEGPLTSSKPLKSHDVGANYVSSTYALRISNHNYNKNLRIKDSSLVGGAVAEAASGQPSSSSAGSVDGFVEGVRALDESIYVHGTELLVQRVGLQLLRARAQISRWLVDIEPEALARVLAEADQHNLQGPAFINVVDQAVASIKAETMFGGHLALGLTPAKKRGNP